MESNYSSSSIPPANIMEKLPKSKTLELRQKHIGGAMKMFFSHDPVKIVRASGQYMYDEQGNQYLDCINNVCHVGHCHPDVVEAAHRQMQVLNTNSRFLHDDMVLLAEKITSTMPESLSVVFMTNSGSEANDLAMRLARHHTKGTDVITLDNAYHGTVVTTMDISPYKLDRNTDGVHPIPDHVHVASCPDVYGGIYRDCDYPGEDMGEKYAADVDEIINKIHSNGRKLSCYISESMQSCAGQVIFPKGYLKNVYRSVRKAGGVCIADEVQVGFGRVGTHYWAFQPEGVVPDIVTMGKPMGNGHPVSAVVTTREISDSFQKSGMTYFNTYGGNPVSCAIALAVLNVIEKEGLLEHAIIIGQYLKDKLRELQKELPIIGDIRGRGMFVGIALVKDLKTREPATKEANETICRMKKEFILLSTDGPHENVLKFKPPLCFNKDNVDVLVNKLAVALRDISTSSEEKAKNTQEINELSHDKNNSAVVDFGRQCSGFSSSLTSEVVGEPSAKVMKVH
ncbi:hypothetical protein ScPMuIL_003823 [Solemya velum]